LKPDVFSRPTADQLDAKREKPQTHCNMPACKLTPEVEVKILSHIAAGNKLVDAAREAGIAAETARNWVKWGNAGKKPYADFASKLKIAEATPRTSAMKHWHDAMGDDWRAAKAFVEYLDKQDSSPANISRQLEDILQVIEDVLGKPEAKKVLRAIVERSSGEAVEEPGAPIRLVTSR